MGVKLKKQNSSFVRANAYFIDEDILDIKVLIICILSDLRLCLFILRLKLEEKL